MTEPGFTLFAADPDVARWARAAEVAASDLLRDPQVRARQLRHGETWFVGVDLLPNLPDGSVGSVPLRGPWENHIDLPMTWHSAQVSVVYPGYPRQDPAESDANHRYRRNRHAAHVDGLLPIGSDRRRFLREPHAFVLGLPLNGVTGAPLMVWPGSHLVMGAAFRDAIGGEDPCDVDLTEPYHAARRICFDTITPMQVDMRPGQAVLLHRHLLHGVAAWAAEESACPEGRMVAYFRPQFSAQAWLAR
ncbi:MAG: hypothetical protein AAF943_02595 [Pseudomonadota bacterium]